MVQDLKNHWVQVSGGSILQIICLQATFTSMDPNIYLLPHQGQGQNIRHSKPDPKIHFLLTRVRNYD